MIRFFSKIRAKYALYLIVMIIISILGIMITSSASAILFIQDIKELIYSYEDQKTLTLKALKKNHEPAILFENYTPVRSKEAGLGVNRGGFYKHAHHKSDENIWYIKDSDDIEILADVILSPLVRKIMGENFAPIYKLTRDGDKIKVRSKALENAITLDQLLERNKKDNQLSDLFIYEEKENVFSANFYKEIEGFPKLIFISWLLNRDDLHYNNIAIISEGSHKMAATFDFGHSGYRLLKNETNQIENNNAFNISYLINSYLSQFNGRKELLLDKEFISSLQKVKDDLSFPVIEQKIQEGYLHSLEGALYSKKDINKIFGYKERTDFTKKISKKVYDRIKVVQDLITHLKVESAIKNNNLYDFAKNIVLFSDNYKFHIPSKYYRNEKTKEFIKNNNLEDLIFKYVLMQNDIDGEIVPTYPGFGFDSLYESYHKKRNNKFEEIYLENFAKREAKLYKKLEQACK